MTLTGRAGNAVGVGLGTQDLHVHTTMSDGTVALERVVALARERGVRVGVADHISTRTPAKMVATRAALLRYLDALEREPVFVAGEFCWCDELSTSLPREILDRFDYRIGSNHGFALPDGQMGSPWWETLPPPWADRPQEVMEIMVHNLCDMVRTMGIQIAAHATLTPPALLSLEPEIEHWWTESREDRFVGALAESGVALEISNRYRLPHDRLLRKGKEAGIRFSLGSDGHHEHQIGRLDWAVEAARRAGIGDADLFTPEPRRKMGW